VEGSDHERELRLAIHHISAPKDEWGTASTSSFATDYDFDLSTLPNMPLWQLILAASTKSPNSLRQADRWLRDCLQEHTVCRKISSNSKFVPSRLLQIRALETSLSDPRVRLCKTRNLLHKPTYMTLSHCWGAGNICKLLNANLKDLR
jgi:hypothetical protein